MADSSYALEEQTRRAQHLRFVFLKAKGAVLLHKQYSFCVPKGAVLLHKQYSELDIAHRIHSFSFLGFFDEIIPTKQRDHQSIKRLCSTRLTAAYKELIRRNWISNEKKSLKQTRKQTKKQRSCLFALLSQSLVHPCDLLRCCNREFPFNPRLSHGNCSRSFSNSKCNSHLSIIMSTTVP
jgi:hypothetical protein